MCTKVRCVKCDGKGHIAAFGHYAGGVCFMCYGSGNLSNDLDAERATLSDDNRKRAHWIMAATDADFARMTFKQLEAARTFAHMPCPGFPDLYAAWMAKGDDYFFAAQEVAYHASMAKFAADCGQPWLNSR